MSNRSFGLIAVVSCLMFYASNVSAQKGQKVISLHVGSVKTLDVGKVVRVAIGLDSILGSSILENGQLLLIPKAPGETDIHIWKKGERFESFRVLITASNTVRGLRTLRKVLSSFENVSAKEVDGIFVLEGKVSPDRFDMYQEIISQFPSVISLVTAENVIMRDMINFKIQVLEVNKNYAKNLGIAWNRAAAGPNIGFVKNFRANGRYVLLNEEDPIGGDLFNPDAPVIGFNDESSYSFLGIVFGLSSQINLLKEDGAARTLAEPYLSTRSGEAATFHSGGSYPLAVLNEFGQPVVQMQDYGIQLSIEPISDEKGNIISSISAEMSTLDFSTIVNGVPGLLTRETESVVNLKSGDTMIISGLVQLSDSKAVEKIPILGDIPILGELFTSKNFNENKTELIILVTPQIVSPDYTIPKGLEKHIDSLKKVLSKSKIEDELLE